MRLTDTTVRNAKPNGSKSRKLFDGDGLYLEVTAKGKKWWRFKYRFAGKSKCISFGVYPAVKLIYARKQREDARELLAKGIDPSEQRKIGKLNGTKSDENTFKAVAESWFNSKKINWSKGYQVKISRILEKNLYPWIGGISIDKITAPNLLEALNNTVSQEKYDTAMTAKQTAGRVFRFGIATEKVKHDITSGLREALTVPKTKHMAAITEPEEVGKLMLALDIYKGSTEVHCALRFMALTFVRSKELRHAEWREIDWNKSLWYIEAEKMKKKSGDHIVPLSSQALEILRDVHRITGSYRYIFPNARSSARPMSENAMLLALRTLGYKKDEMTIHGFRATARTLLDEQLGFRIDCIEQQLAHAVKDPLGRAYNRTKHLPERGKMMQVYANYLDKLKAATAAKQGIIL